jgi:thiosulfate/3-mercaptopyruvate sulfurtransferase
VDAAEWAKAFGDGQDAEDWSRRIGALGIDRDSKVVVYDDNLSRDAARIWWILRYWGAGDVRLLNGGWLGWTKGGLAVESGEPKPVATAEFTANAQPERLATRQQVLASLGRGSLQIIDARSEAEFCGIDKQQNQRAGAIPGARHMEWVDVMDKDTQRLKPAHQLRALFQEAGIDLDAPAATHCQSGGRALAFAMELMGADDVANYYRGWGEWGNLDDTPIVPGKTKSDE